MNAIHKTVVAILSAGPAFCGVVGYLPLGMVLNQADAVVVGTVASSSTAAGVLNLSLTVGRTLKGSPPPGTTILASWFSQKFSSGGVVGSEPQVGLLSGNNGVWFLQQSGSSWIVLPFMTGDFPAENICIPVPAGELPAAYRYESSADPQTKLLREIATAAEDPTTTDAISSLEATRVMDGLDSKQLQPVLVQLASSSRGTARATGLAGLLRQGVPTAITALTGTSLTAFPVKSQGYLASAICEYRSTEASGITALGILLASGQTRACAAHALREIHTQQTVPLLVGLFTDSSAQIRYDSVIGVAQFAMGFPVVRAADKPAAMSTFKPGPGVTDDMSRHYPALDTFSKNEQEYISYWREWSAAHPAQ